MFRGGVKQVLELEVCWHPARGPSLGDGQGEAWTLTSLGEQFLKSWSGSVLLTDALVFEKVAAVTQTLLISDSVVPSVILSPDLEQGEVEGDGSAKKVGNAGWERYFQMDVGRKTRECYLQLAI